MNKDDEKHGAIRRKDSYLFLLSLGIALVFWLASKFSKEYSYSYDFTIHYTLPDSLSFSELPPSLLRVELKGSGWDLFRFGINEKNRHLALDGDAARYTQTDLMTAIERQIDIPDIRIEKISEPLVELKFEESMAKKVPLVADVQVDYGEGVTQRRAVQLLPDSVTVTGPSSLVRTIGEWSTRPYTFAEQREDAKLRVKLNDPASPLISIKPSEVEMRIHVEPLTEKSLFVPVILASDSTRNMSVFPSSVQVTCSVGLSKFDDLSKDDFKIVARIKANRNTASHYVPVELVDYPAEVSSVRFQPKTVEVLFLESAPDTETKQQE